MTEISNHIDIDLEFLAEWIQANKLSLNINKTKYIIFANRRIDFNPDISISPHEIEPVKVLKA